MISKERKEELLAVIKQQEDSWTENRSMMIGSDLSANSELVFREPQTFCIDGRMHTINKAVLAAGDGRYGNCRVRFLQEDGTGEYLVDVVNNSEITDETDAMICMALSFIGNELSHKMLGNLRNSPSDDLYFNMLARFFR